MSEDQGTNIIVEMDVQMQEGALLATWAFSNRADGSDANRVMLASGQEYRVTYRLRDVSNWRLVALSLRRVPSSSTGFATVEQGQTTPSLLLPDDAGTLAIEEFSSEHVTLCVNNELPQRSAPLILGMAFTVCSKGNSSSPKQSSQDPQMVLEPRPVIPEP